MSGGPKRSTMYSLGAFVRHVVHGLTADTGGPSRRVVRQESAEQVHQTAGGKVTLRRTTIEEVEIEERARDTGQQ